MSAACLVADSGPLIALGRLDLLGLPSRYFEPVLVTSSVWLEVMNRLPNEPQPPSNRVPRARREISLPARGVWRETASERPSFSFR